MLRGKNQQYKTSWNPEIVEIQSDLLSGRMCTFVSL